MGSWFGFSVVNARLLHHSTRFISQNDFPVLFSPLPQPLNAFRIEVNRRDGIFSIGFISIQPKDHRAILERCAHEVRQHPISQATAFHFFEVETVVLAPALEVLGGERHPLVNCRLRGAPPNRDILLVVVRRVETPECGQSLDIEGIKGTLKSGESA